VRVVCGCAFAVLLPLCRTLRQVKFKHPQRRYKNGAGYYRTRFGSHVHGCWEARRGTEMVIGCRPSVVVKRARRPLTSLCLHCGRQPGPQRPVPASAAIPVGPPISRSCLVTGNGSYPCTLPCRITQVHVAGRRHHLTPSGLCPAYLLLLGYRTTESLATTTSRPQTLLIAVNMDLSLAPPSRTAKGLDVVGESSPPIALADRMTSSDLRGCFLIADRALDLCTNPLKYA